MPRRPTGCSRTVAILWSNLSRRIGENKVNPDDLIAALSLLPWEFGSTRCAASTEAITTRTCPTKTTQDRDSLGLWVTSSAICWRFRSNTQYPSDAADAGAREGHQRRGGCSKLTERRWSRLQMRITEGGLHRLVTARHGNGDRAATGLPEALQGEDALWRHVREGRTLPQPADKKRLA